MGDPEKVAEYPDEKQRAAVCYSRMAKATDYATGPGPNGHVHYASREDTRTSIEEDHDHPIEIGAARTGPGGMDQHDHAMPDALARIELTAKVFKVDTDQRLVYGWLSVTEKDGALVVDSQRDVIREDTLVKAVHTLMTDTRAAKVMHSGKRVGEFVEAIVFTRDVQKALGIDLGLVGAFACLKVHDDVAWERVKAGELRAFSIGGTGVRRKLT